MTEDQARKAKIIYDHYGDKVQRRQLVEECSELIQALCKYERVIEDHSGVNIVKVEKDILGELADVLIMIEQVSKGMFGSGSELLNNMINYKLDRQISRIRISRHKR